MSKYPQPFWAVLLAGMGVALAISVLFRPGVSENILLGVLSVASGLVSGALGYIGGHAAGATANPTTPDLGPQTVEPASK